jgi:NADPH-dependent 2,4-dienoyl-CoA reductase/sulfur reductase-like enzyme
MHVVIVGASLAGLRTVQSLRSAGFDGQITVIGAETQAFYDRPPLSKEVLTGKVGIDDIQLTSGDDLRALEIDLILGAAATKLDLDRQHIEIDSRDRLNYDELVIATGARPRRLEQFENKGGVYVLRTADDAVTLRTAMAHLGAMIIVGAGFIGSEVASSACQLGIRTTVLEAARAPLGRVLDHRIGTRLGRLHHEQGSDLRCRASVVESLGKDNVEGVALADGTTVEGEAVVIGVGTVPNTEWLATSSIDCANGVACDSRGRVTGAPHLHALGDVSRWRSPRYGECVRNEHWTGACDQAAVIAADLLGLPLPAEPVPYVWSDQFGRRIQIAGRSRPDDELHVLIDNEESFAAITGGNGRLSSVVAVDQPRLVARYRRSIAHDATWEEALSMNASG